jgi:hypothetical protein
MIGAVCVNGKTTIQKKNKTISCGFCQNKIYIKVVIIYFFVSIQKIKGKKTVYSFIYRHDIIALCLWIFIFSNFNSNCIVKFTVLYHINRNFFRLFYKNVVNEINTHVFPTVRFYMKTIVCGFTPPPPQSNH